MTLKVDQSTEYTCKRQTMDRARRPNRQQRSDLAIEILTARKRG